MATDLTAESLAQLLREAEHAHGEYERTLGHRDDDGRAGTRPTSSTV